MREAQLWWETEGQAGIKTTEEEVFSIAPTIGESCGCGSSGLVRTGPDGFFAVFVDKDVSTTSLTCFGKLRSRLGIASIGSISSI